MQIYVFVLFLPNKFTPKYSQLMKVFCDLGAVGSKITCLSCGKGLTLSRKNKKTIYGKE